MAVDYYGPTKSFWYKATSAGRQDIKVSQGGIFWNNPIPMGMPEMGYVVAKGTCSKRKAIFAQMVFVNFPRFLCVTYDDLRTVFPEGELLAFTDGVSEFRIENQDVVGVSTIVFSDVIGGLPSRCSDSLSITQKIGAIP